MNLIYSAGSRCTLEHMQSESIHTKWYPESHILNGNYAIYVFTIWQIEIKSDIKCIYEFFNHICIKLDLQNQFASPRDDVGTFIISCIWVIWEGQHSAITPYIALSLQARKYGRYRTHDLICVNVVCSGEIIPVLQSLQDIPSKKSFSLMIIITYNDTYTVTSNIWIRITNKSNRIVAPVCSFITFKRALQSPWMIKDKNRMIFCFHRLFFYISMYTYIARFYVHASRCIYSKSLA